MKRKGYKRRIIIAYTLRILLIVIFLGMLFLMVCGCLYLRDIFRAQESMEEANTSLNNIYVEEESCSSGQNQTITRCVILDAGHGGKDVGTSYGNIYEKDINLSIALEIKECLEQEGIEVILTRSSDEFISLEERAATANQTDAEVFVSIHCNYYEDDSSVSGVEGYYCSDSEEGKELAECILNALGNNESITVRNVKSEEYYVLEHTNMPALLLEVGYLSNFEERQQLSNGDYKKILSQEIAKGILSYFK